MSDPQTALTVGRVLDVEALRGDILVMQRSKYKPKWVHLDELFALIDKWEAEQSHVPPRIEQEAIAKERERIRAGVEGLPDVVGEDCNCDWMAPDVDLAPECPWCELGARLYRDPVRHMDGKHWHMQCARNAAVLAVIDAEPRP